MVQHHPARAELLDALLRALRPLETLVAPDPEPDAPRAGPLRSYLAALELAPADATHVLVIQDDAEPCRDFAELALAALELEPELPIAFFCPRQPLDLARRVYSARELGEPFAAIARSWTPVVALSWPTELAGAFLEYVAAQKWRHPRADDEAVGRFMRARGAVVLATCPSLVEHPDVVPSLVGSRPRRGRTAAWFADA